MVTDTEEEYPLETGVEITLDEDEGTVSLRELPNGEPVKAPTDEVLDLIDPVPRITTKLVELPVGSYVRGLALWEKGGNGKWYNNHSFALVESLESSELAQKIVYGGTDYNILVASGKLG